MSKRQHKKRPERILMVVGKGVLQPADSYSRDKLRARGYRTGDEVLAQLTKPRNAKFHRLVHQFGRLVSDNIPAFTGMDAHKVLKRLQMEANIGCEEIVYSVAGAGMITQRIPLSLSFESMDDGDFHEVFRGLCRHVSEKYWPDLTPEQIEDMAGVMVDET